MMAAEDNTQVVLCPPKGSASTLNAGEWFGFQSRNHFEIHSVDGKPILVGQFRQLGRAGAKQYPAVSS